jgi:hypothetical protein
MQGTAEFHHEIADAVLPQPTPVFDDPTALHTAVDMFDPPPTLVQRLVGSVLLPGQFLPAGFLGRHEDLHLGEREGQEAQILQEPTPRGQGIRRRVSNGLLMDATAIGVAEEEDEEQGVDEEHIFHRVVFFLATLTRHLFHRVLGADDAPFRAVMGKRGDADAVVGTATTGAASSSSGTIMVAASASETPKRCARAVRERVGASPRVRSAARRTGRRTCIH